MPDPAESLVLRRLRARAPPVSPPDSSSAILQGSFGLPSFWPRSYSLTLVLVVALVFGALSYVPFVASVPFYPKGILVSSGGFLNRSAVGNTLQMVYGLVLLGLGYLVGQRIDFRRDYLWLLPIAYFGAVLGYVVGLPGLDTTTVSGGVFLYQTDLLNASHIQSAFFNSATLMGLLVAGIGLSSVYRRRRAAAAMHEGLGQPTSTKWLIAVFALTTTIAFFAFMLPTAFQLLFGQLAGSSTATTGFLYTFETNSIVLGNPLSFFVAHYLIGGKVRVYRDATKVMAMLFASVLIGSVVGNPMGSYATVYAATGMSMFPNYLANATTLASFFATVMDVSFAGAFLGFAAISLANTKGLAKRSELVR